MIEATSSSSAAARLSRGARERGQTHPAVAHAVGLTLTVCGGFLVLAAGVDLTDTADAAPALAITGAVSGAAGLALWRGLPFPKRIRTAEAFSAVAAAAVALVVVSTAVYLATGTFDRLDRALFESVAGLSTTALSVLQALEATPDGVLFWRAATQWVGGLGAVLVVIGVLPSLGLAGLDVTEASQRGGSLVLLTPNLRRLLRRLVLLYVALTGAGTLLYLVGGMTLFDAVTYAFTTISTGGFANHARSFAYFDSEALEWAAVGGMVLGGANLALVWHGLRGVGDSFLRSLELRAYVAMLVVSAAALVAWTAPDGGITHESARHATFTVASALSTTGYTVTDWNVWAHGAQIVLLVLIGIGSMSGSTGGGFRVLRVLTLLAYVRREVVRQLHPRAVSVVKVGGVVVDDGITARMIGHQALYVLIAAAGAVAIAATGTDLTTAVSGAISALATFGPGLGELARTEGALGLEMPARLALMVLMVVGRLEIYPLVVGGGVVAAARRLSRARP